MPSSTISRDQARELDRRAVADYGMHSLMLMENAGRGAADRLCEWGISGRVVICCGVGNNGGDGLVLARHLDLRGHAVQVVIVGDLGKLTADAAVNYQVVAKSGLPLGEYQPRDFPGVLREAAWVIDALLGTGAKGEPREPLREVITQINRSGRRVLAIDLPSGLDCDSGQAADATIRADHTCTFVAAKPGFLTPGADRYTGLVHVVDIGAPRRLVDEILRPTPRQT